MSEHRRRSTDRGWRRLLRENWYRDVWLLLITLVVGLTVWSSTVQANRAHSLAQQIQQQRTDSIRSECLAENKRHRDTLRALDYVIKRAERHARPARARQLRSSRKVTALMINALAPYRKCSLVVRRSTR